ncbi:hypothetical protein [Falsiroseomonas tokyonensis]|uniref:Uncharacterized protein n=1 Tax=Falsiroseomonas tokyonensis TaxID=430521 RepID=A0ABV7BYT6_9PROT|nr:hypothetical protein [Falsiroseomonas tokyonensis]MBU8540790.1 hypothetical protein [Falsiroseomonas tokyonensis]
MTAALKHMATAIAAQRRADDLAVMGRNAPGDTGAFLAMDLRAAKAALEGLRKGGFAVVQVGESR